MKLITSICLSLTMLIGAMVHAQDLNGVATYKTQRKVDIQLDSAQIGDAMKQQIMAQLKKQFDFNGLQVEEEQQFNGRIMIPWII